MLKISTSDVKNILATVPPLLRELQEKCASLEEKVAHYEKRERVEKIASEMEAKNLNNHLTHDEKVDSLMQRDDLEVIEAAVGMTPNQVGFGTLDKQAGNAIDALTTFVENLK